MPARTEAHSTVAREIRRMAEREGPLIMSLVRLSQGEGQARDDDGARPRAAAADKLVHVILDLAVPRVRGAGRNGDPADLADGRPAAAGGDCHVHRAVGLVVVDAAIRRTDAG